MEILNHLYGKRVLQRDEIELFVLTVGASWPIICGRFTVILPWTNLALSLLLASLMDDVRKAELADDLLAIMTFSDVQWDSLATDALNQSLDLLKSSRLLGNSWIEVLLFLLLNGFSKL